MVPLVDVIRMVDTEEELFMAYIYLAMEDYKLKLSGGSVLEMKSLPCNDFLKEFLDLLIQVLFVKGFGVPLIISILKRGIAWSMIG
ncbi:hypothetical protein GIB67_012329 [Kingdonia uniflora]|uniref:Uncharacterized protein n=1 Tax=Kingdonia uniflora TaxID=39325 RepID=A0A7J7MVT3_9MAGN|nr:hypothetical protein GIB67_012329 [Kingdonia uniflora]